MSGQYLFVCSCVTKLVDYMLLMFNVTLECYQFNVSMNFYLRLKIS